MAHARIDRKSFLKRLGVVAAACVARPASAAVARGDSTPALDLPRKTKAAARIVAFRAPGL